jgi:hypothetical protein
MFGRELQGDFDWVRNFEALSELDVPLSACMQGLSKFAAFWKRLGPSLNETPHSGDET